MRRPFIFTSLGVVRGESKRGNRKCGPENTAIKWYWNYFVTISVILLDTRTCIILFYFRYSHITSDDNVPVLQFIVDIFEILKYSNNR